MTTPTETRQLQGSILNIACVKDSTFCIDNVFYISEINQNLHIGTSIRVIKDIESPHRYSHAFGISPHSYFCFPIMGERKAFVLELNGSTLKHIATLEDHDGDIESCAFSHDGRFLPQVGKTEEFLYEGRSFLAISSLLARSDYISTIRFSKSGDFIAISGFDKFTMIFDVLRHRIAFNFATNDVVEDSCFFEHDEKFC